MWDKIGYIVYSPMLKFYLKNEVKMTHICTSLPLDGELVKACICMNDALRNEACIVWMMQNHSL